MRNIIIRIGAIIVFICSFAVKASPGSVAYFSASPSTINQGDSTLLSWGKPHGYSGAVTFNFYVQKPTESSPWLKAGGVSYTSFNRRINMLGHHSFYI